MNRLLQAAIVLSLIIALGSCASRRDIVYLQPTSPQIDLSNYQSPRIQNDDLLTIVVSAADIKATIPFNQQSPYQVNAAGSDLAFKPAYLVDENGEIDFPVIGRLRVHGMTRMEAAALIREKLDTYIVSPSVNVTFANFRVTVLGEVHRPGTYTLPQERITIFEALGLAGDINIKGLRKNILLLREKDGIKQTHRLDLTTDSVLNSPYYYLAQNDVIYVEPNASQIRDSRFGQNTNVLISVSSLFITVVTLVFTLSRN